MRLGRLDVAPDARRLLVVDEGEVASAHVAAVGHQPDLVVRLFETTADAEGQLADRLVDVRQSKAMRNFVERGLAASVASHVRAQIPEQKLIGRRVLVTGFGSRGRWLAREFREMGCRVAVADDDCLRAIDAADDGYESHRSIKDALRVEDAALVLIPPGSRPLDRPDLETLPNRCVLHGHPALVRGIAIMSRVTAAGSWVRTGPGRESLVLGGRTGSRHSPIEGLSAAGDDLYRASILAALREASVAPGHYDGRQVDRILDRLRLFRLMYETYLRDGWNARE